MKTFYYLTTILAIFLFSFGSCQKDFPSIENRTNCDTLNIHDTTRIHDTLRIHDTICIHDTVAPISLTKTQILVQKDWIIDELARNISGLNSQFIRGGINSTGVTYSNMKFHFNLNGTGTYQDENANVRAMTWSFTNTAQTNITLIVSGASTYSWIIVELKDNFLYNTSLAGSNILLTTRMIQIP